MPESGSVEALKQRQQEFLAKMQGMQAKIIAGMNNPALKEKVREMVMMQVKKALEQAGITPDAPNGAQRAEEFLKALPEWVLGVLAGEDIDLNQPELAETSPSANRLSEAIK